MVSNMKIKLTIISLFAILLLAANTGHAEQPKPDSPADFAAGKVLLAQLKEQAATRKQVLNRPYVFVRSQTKYSGRLYQDFYTWFDRPLFASRRLWESGPSDTKQASYRKTFELYQQYGLDGFMTFAWPNEYDRYLKPLYQTAEKMKLDANKFHIMFDISPGASYIDIAPETLMQIANNPYSFRVNGKSVISSYTLDSKTPAQLAPDIAKLRQRSGDKVLILPMIWFQSFNDANGNRVTAGDMSDMYRLHGSLPASMLRQMQEYLRGYLNVCDGLYIGQMPNNPDFTYDKKYVSNVLYPLFKSVLAEPQYNGKKLLAQQMCVGYTSYHGAQNRSRDGTKTLRDNLDLAAEFHPDILIGTEWDEENEDTHFQPTVAKPMSSQRIIKYYMSRFKGIAPTPNANDDLSIPNFIISQRRQIMLGHVMDVELLNVPDTTDGKPYSVQLDLLDQNGKVVFHSQPVQYNTAEIKDKTFDLASEDYKDCQVLRSQLTIEYNGKKRVFSTGLPFTVLHATTAWDQTYFCTPLRNVLQPQDAKVLFTVDQNPIKPGIHQASISANINSPEKLAAVEVMQDSHVIFAYDPKNEYLRNDPDRRMIDLSWGYINQPSRIAISYKVNLQNAPSAVTFSQPMEDAKPSAEIPTDKAIASKAFTDKTGSWNGEHYYGNADWYTRDRLISIKKEDLDAATITISGTEANGKNKGKEFSWTVPLKELGEYGVKSTVFDDGLMLAVQTQYRPQHNTLPLDTGKVLFTKQLMVDDPNSTLALRLVTEDGKIWWSKPLETNADPSAETVPVDVYSDTAKKAIKLQVAKNRVPDINYNFTPRWGNILQTDSGRGFYGHAGSYIVTAIDFFALGSNSMGQPFRSYSADIFKGADRPAPQWVKTEDGQWALSFDGEHGNFLALPNVVIPQRAGFALSFDVKPAEIKKDQVLFANQWETKGTFILSVKEGKFSIYFNQRTLGDPSLPAWSYKDFDTDIPLYPGKWQKVLLSYDESKLTLTANGKTQSFPFKGVGLYLQGSVFGGYGDRDKDGTIPFYHGLLRSLEIKHYVNE